MSVTVAALGLGLGAEPAMDAAQAIRDEAQVPAYTLPDPLRGVDGRVVRSAADWVEWRRAEVLGRFMSDVYGRSPGRPRRVAYEVGPVDWEALGGKAIRKSITVRFTEAADGPAMEILLYVPKGAAGPVPAFLGLNFHGNHTVASDPGIPLSTRWMRNDERTGRVGNRATEASRGTAASRWPVETILARGYALATVYCGDIEPDHADGWRTGVRTVFPVGDGGGGAEPAAAPIETFAADAWGCIAAWAWGLSRALDYLEADTDVDAGRVTVVGHSRLGKTALWAGATDTRFAAVISNNSGCGGAALSRRAFGETVERINSVFPHWFCTNFKRYNGRESELPVDQHQLLALMAPRPVYVASAEQDWWADPRGEFLALQAAEGVYQLFGIAGLGVRDLPAPDQPVGGVMRYHLRTGEHDITAYDWAQYLDFADRHLGGGRR